MDAMQRRPGTEMRRGYEIWVTASGFDSRVACDGVDDFHAVRAEVRERLHKVLAGEPVAGTLHPDLGVRAHVLSVPLDHSGSGLYSAWQSGLPSRSLRSLVEAAVAELDR